MDLIPQPRSCSLLDGTFDRGLVCRVHPAQADDAALMALSAESGLRIEADAAVDEHCLLAGAARPGQAPDHVQGYEVAIADDSLLVQGGGLAGFRHAIHCLRQLWAAEGRLPAVRIADEPAFDLRIHHDDLSRGQISTVEDFKRLIDQLAFYRYNAYTWYIEDVLHLPHFPDIGEGRGKLMPAEVRELVAYAAERGIEIFPTISLIGHHHNLLALPAYARYGAEVFQPMSALDPKAEGLYDFLEQVIDDICAQFDSPWFHMCFDEVIGLSEDAFIGHVNWCAEQLVARGKTPVMWLDMFYNHFGLEALKRIHPQVVACPWVYDADALRGTRAEVVAESLRQRRTWGLSAHRCFGSLIGDLQATADCAAAWAEALRESEASALASAIWGDGGNENQRQAQWHHYAQFAEIAWCGKVVEDFVPRFLRQHFGSDDERLPAAVCGPSGIDAAMRRRLYGLFHQPNAALLRLARREPALIELARAQVPVLAQLSEALRALRDTVARRGDELDLRRCELDKTAFILRRIQLVVEPGLPLPSAERQELRETIAGLRQEYRRLWLRHNRPEGLEISEATYDMLLADLEAEPLAEPDDCRCLALPEERAVFEPGLAGLPIGLHEAPGQTHCFPMAGSPFVYGRRSSTPFRFFDEAHSHLVLPPGETLRLGFERCRVLDCHLVASCPKGDGAVRDQLAFELLRGDDVVYREALQSVRHLCDWWAPQGTHMWAGGGLAYVDPQRVRAVVDLPRYTLTAVSRFPFAGCITCDTVELRNPGPEEVQLFALTLQLV